MSKIKAFSSIFIVLTCALLLVLGVTDKSASIPIQTASDQNITKNNADGPRGPALPITSPTSSELPADSLVAVLQSTPSTPEPATPTPQPPKKPPTKNLTASIAKEPVSAKPSPAPTTQATCQGGFTQEFFCLMNQYRAEKGLKAISQNSGLASVSLTHSQWMNATGIFSHTGINGSRLTERCNTAGITCRGENLAEGAKSAQNLFDMWKASGSHNKNLLGNFSSGGLGIAGQYITLLLN